MIGVITCPRPGGVKYFPPLLSAIDETCPGERKLLFCDGSNETWSGWQTVALDLSEEKMGTNDNKFIGWKVLEHAGSLGEDLLFLEDDARPVDTRSLADAVDYVVPGGCAFSSLHRSRWTMPGVHPGIKFMMSQAVKLPLRSIETLLVVRDIALGDWEAVRGIDTALAVVSRNARLQYEQTERSYFHHVGEVSAVRNDYSGRSVSL